MFVNPKNPSSVLLHELTGSREGEEGKHRISGWGKLHKPAQAKAGARGSLQAGRARALVCGFGKVPKTVSRDFETIGSIIFS